MNDQSEPSSESVEFTPFHEPAAKKKVLLVITKSNWGGAQRYVFDIATGLPQEQYDTLVSFGSDGPLGERLRMAGIRTHSIAELGRDVSLKGDFATFRALLSLLEKERPDVLHLNSSKIGGLGALVGRLHNLQEWLHRKKTPPCYTRIIFTGHGWAFNEDRPRWQQLLILLVHWLTVLLTDKTIAVSQTTGEDIARLPFLRGKMVVVYNGIKFTKPMPRSEALLGLGLEENWNAELSEAANDERPLLVGTIAELHRNKGIKYAIEAMSVISRYTSRKILYAVIAGGEEKERLQSSIASFGLEDTVKLLGYRTNAARLIPAFDIFLLPSLTEAMPYVILEAGSVGIPIIATAVGGIPEVIEDMKTGILLQPRNPNEIARAIGYLAEEDGRRVIFADRARSRVQEHFALESMLAKTIALYD